MSSSERDRSDSTSRISKRQPPVEQIGQDGWELLSLVRGAEAPEWLRDIPAVEILHQVWLQQFWVEEGKIGWRSNENIPL